MSPQLRHSVLFGVALLEKLYVRTPLWRSGTIYQTHSLPVDREFQEPSARSCKRRWRTFWAFVIPAKAFARDYVITGVGLSVCLFVCLLVTTITKLNVDGSGRNFLGRFLGGKASPSSFSVTIASRVLRLLSKNAVNHGFFSNVNKPTNHLTHNK